MSKLALFDRQIGRLYPGMVDHGTKLHHLYRALDIQGSDRPALPIAIHPQIVGNLRQQFSSGLVAVTIQCPLAAPAVLFQLFCVIWHDLPLSLLRLFAVRMTAR